MDEYTLKADNFLKAHGLEVCFVLVGNDCPTYCPDKDKEPLIGVYPRATHIHGQHFKATISGKDRAVSFDFWDSYRDAEIRKIGTKEYRNGSTHYKYGIGNKAPSPTAYDLLACITKTDPGSFNDFCSDFGMDNDSIKARNVYNDVTAEYDSVRRFFKKDELEELQDIN